MTNKQQIKFIQRWIGVRESGDLNDNATVKELLNDLPGITKYLAAKEAVKRPAEIVTEAANVEGTFPDYSHSSPNKGGAIIPRGIVLHHSAGSFQGTLSWCLQKKSQVSYHVLIHPDGSRHHLVPLNRRAWHAGKSRFKGQSGCNGFMLGVAFAGSTYDRELTPLEIASFVEFERIARDEFGWNDSDVTDHRTVSPGRKNDLNPVEFAKVLAAMKA